LKPMETIRKIPVGWQTMLVMVLLVTSALFYFIHYLLFRDPHHIFIFLLGDMAFVPIEVLLVTLIIHRVLSEREKKTLMEKLNMLIGAFFSELGMPLLRLLSEYDPGCDTIRDEIKGKSFSKQGYPTLKQQLKTHDCRIDIHEGDLKALRDFLFEKRDFLLRMLENPSLFKHDTFTDLLWAVFHLMEELVYHKDLDRLSEADSRHISKDIKRAYDLTLLEWADYMKYMKENYPYLFALAIRTNPFNSRTMPGIGGGHRERRGT